MKAIGQYFNFLWWPLNRGLLKKKERKKLTCKFKIVEDVCIKNPLWGVKSLMMFMQTNP